MKGIPKGSQRVKSLKENDKTAKLMAMGIMPGSLIQIVRSGPFGKVYYVKVDRQTIALRSDELDTLIF